MKDLSEAAAPGSASLAALKHPCAPTAISGGGSSSSRKFSASPSNVVFLKSLSPRVSVDHAVAGSLNGNRADSEEQSRSNVGESWTRDDSNGSETAAVAVMRRVEVSGVTEEVEGSAAVMGGGEEKDSLGALIKRNSDQANGGGGGGPLRIDTLGKC